MLAVGGKVDAVEIPTRLFVPVRAAVRRTDITATEGRKGLRISSASFTDQDIAEYGTSSLPWSPLTGGRKEERCYLWAPLESCQTGNLG